MVTDTASSTPAAEPEPALVEEAKSFFEQAQAAIGDAIEIDRGGGEGEPRHCRPRSPRARSPAVGGAAYAASRLLGGEDAPAPKGKAKG